jgi:hypothetical protein
MTVTTHKVHARNVRLEDVVVHEGTAFSVYAYATFPGEHVRIFGEAVSENSNALLDITVRADSKITVEIHEA